MKLKRFTASMMAFVLLIGTILIGLPSKSSASTELPREYNSITIIEETDEVFEYILNIAGTEIRYVELTTEMSDGRTVISTKAYNEETNELLQDFETTIENDNLVDQTINKNEEMPTPGVITNENLIVPFATTKSNKSLVSVLNIGYTKNYTTNKGTATYAKSGTKTAKLSSATFDKHASGVDSIRGVETGTLAGWLIAAFTGGGLTAGKIISLKTAKVILKNIAGPVAVVSNAWALGQWFYYYNIISSNFSKIK